MAALEHSCDMIALYFFLHGGLNKKGNHASELDDSGTDTQAYYHFISRLSFTGTASNL
jgi:hypothetical protein